jgi:hypothetical protein
LKEEELTKIVSEQGPGYQHLELIKVWHLKVTLTILHPYLSFYPEIRTVVPVVIAVMGFA